MTEIDPNRRIGRYFLMRRIASGGMAELFLGKLVGPAGFEREVVIKKILPQWSSDSDFVAMLIDEAKIAVQLNHPNLVSIFELGREGEVYYIAMEFVNGVDLRKLIQRCASRRTEIPVGIAVGIASQCLQGLAYAHQRTDGKGRPLQIVHRDISPQNILVSYDGQVKIADFGIAKAASRSQETVAGVLKGKFAYMSPEQANHEDLDGRSDLFSLAVVLYELLTGERLFYRGSDLDTLDRVRRGVVEFSAAAVAKIPDGLQSILKKALDRSPAKRFRDAAEFRDALRDFGEKLQLPSGQEETAAFVSHLFQEEARPKEPTPPEETRVMTQATGPLLDETKTVREEILAQSETVFLPETSPPALRVPKTSNTSSTSAFRMILGLAVVVGLSVLVWKFFAKPEKRDVPIAAPPVAVRPIQPVARPIPKDTRPVPPEVPPPIQPSEPAPELPSDMPKAEDPLPALAKIETPGQGYLSVQAIPWGTVTVDGAGRKETPVRRLTLKEGPHTVKVSYEPDGSVVSQKIQLKRDREIVCIAKFRGGKSLRCAE